MVKSRASWQSISRWEATEQGLQKSAWWSPWDWSYCWILRPSHAGWTFMKANSLKMDPRLMSKYKTIKLLEKRVRENLQDLGLDKGVLDSTPKAWSIKGKIDKLDLMKITNICSVKDTFKRMKRQAKDSEKIFANHIADKGPVSRREKSLITRQWKTKQSS